MLLHCCGCLILSVLGTWTLGITETRRQESGDGDSVLDGKWKRVSYAVESVESCVWVKHAREEGRVWP